MPPRWPRQTAAGSTSRRRNWRSGRDWTLRWRNGLELEQHDWRGALSRIHFEARQGPSPVGRPRLAQEVLDAVNTINFISIPGSIVPDQEVLVFGSERLTYAALNDLVARLARRLQGTRTSSSATSSRSSTPTRTLCRRLLCRGQGRADLPAAQLPRQGSRTRVHDQHGRRQGSAGRRSLCRPRQQDCSREAQGDPPASRSAIGDGKLPGSATWSRRPNPTKPRPRSRTKMSPS